MNKMNKKGFTLIEMLVVIAIIAILVAIIVPTVASSTMKAKGAADAANFRSLTAQAAIVFMNGKEDTVFRYTPVNGASGAIVTTKDDHKFESKAFATSGTVTFEEVDGSLKGTMALNGSLTATLDDFISISQTGEIPEGLKAAAGK